MRYRVTHTTIYEYAEPFSSCHNQVRLIPRDLLRQECQNSEIIVDPTPDAIDRHVDWYGNIVESFSLNEPHESLRITAVSDVEVRAVDPVMFNASPAWERVRDQLAGESAPATFDALQYIFDTPYVRSAPALAEYAERSFTANRPMLEAAWDLTKRIHADFEFDPDATTMNTGVLEVLHRRRGVCQDFAHLQIGCLRSLGLPARYVSGYLRTAPPPGGERLIGADASHAWCALWCPALGWTDFDPTNNCVPSESHITLAWGADYGDVSPIKGVVLGGGEQKVKVGVDVEEAGG